MPLPVLDPEAEPELVDAPLPLPLADWPLTLPVSQPSREMDDARKKDAIRFTGSPKVALTLFAIRSEQGEPRGCTLREKTSKEHVACFPFHIRSEPAMVVPKSPGGLRVLTVSSSFETAGSTYGPFLLPHYALTWIVEGKGTTWLDDEPIRTRPGTLMLMRSGMTLRHDWTAQSFQVFAVFDFDVVPVGRDDWPVVRQLEPDEFVFSLYRFMLACDLRGNEGATVVLRSVELMLTMFLTGFTGEMASLLPRLAEPVERALDWIARTVHERPDAPIRLDVLAKHARVAPAHLCRLFRKELGTSPVACASLVRVESCAGLLERTEATLSEIAERYGYSSPFHFSRAFKQAYGIAPSKYRQAFRAGTTTRPGGLLFRHHRLRRYLYEQGPGKIQMVDDKAPSGRGRLDT